MSFEMQPSARPGSANAGAYRATSAIRRVGDCLRVPALAPSLPPRCLVCNAPAHARVRRTLNRIARPESNVALVAILVVCWPALFWLKPVFVDFSLCEAHRRSKRREYVITSALAAALFVGALATTPLGSAGLSLGLLVVALAAGVVAARRQTPMRIRAREGDAVLLEVPSAFLASFTEGGTRG